jgi:hypothetical protein
MNNNVLTRIGVALAALCAPTSFAFAQTPPRGSEVFLVWSSADRILSSRDNFAEALPNEVMSDRDDVVTEPVVSSSANGILIDEPQGAIPHRPCVRVAAPSKSQQFHRHC